LNICCLRAITRGVALAEGEDTCRALKCKVRCLAPENTLLLTHTLHPTHTHTPLVPTSCTVDTWSALSD
jgi:hypothetical protein